MRWSHDIDVAMAVGHVKLTPEGEYALAQDAYELELQLGFLQGPLKQGLEHVKWQKPPRPQG